MTDRGDYTLELDSWLRSQEATERIVSEARDCHGERTPGEDEPPDFFIGDEPIWVCQRCGGNGCLKAGDDGE